MGLIYKSVSPSGKVYIGQTMDLEYRKLMHFHHSNNPKQQTYNSKFHNAIRKYGIENFKWEILFDNILEQHLDEYEIWTIDFFNSYKYGYNSTVGGNGRRGYVCSGSTKEKISKALTGRTISEKHRLNMSKGLKGRISPNKGKRVPEGQRKKISESLKGRKPWNKGLKLC